MALLIKSWIESICSIMHHRDELQQKSVRINHKVMQTIIRYHTLSTSFVIRGLIRTNIIIDGIMSSQVRALHKFVIRKVE